MNNNKFYITNNGFNRLVEASKADVYEDISELYLGIYDKVDLRNLLNSKDAEKFNRKIKFLQETEDYLKNCFANSNEEIKNKASNSSNLFPTGSPKYHVSSECETLRKDYVNFKIPKEIKDQGGFIENKFREFAIENRKLINEGKEDIFLMRINSKFSLKEKIEKIFYENSGVKKIETEDKPMSLSELEIDISSSINNIESFKLTKEGEKAYRNCRYASVDNMRKYAYSEIEVSLLNEKKNLINSILKYNKIKHNNDGSSYSKELLELYGFTPCGWCCKKGSGVFM